jgi:hypothetical protein
MENDRSHIYSGVMIYCLCFKISGGKKGIVCKGYMFYAEKQVNT